jgi:hypothetical protein
MPDRKAWLQLTEHILTSNYNAIANLHALQFTMVHANSSQLIFNSGCLTTDPNNVLFSSRRYQLATISHLTHCCRARVTLRLAVCCQSVRLSVESKSHCDWRSVSQQVLVSSTMWSSWPDIYYPLTATALFSWGALSDERTDPSFVHAAGPCQLSLSRVQVPWDLRPHITVSD